VEVWPSDNGSSHINKVTLQHTQTSVSTESLRCITIYHLPVYNLDNQPLRLTQPPTLNRKGNKYWSRDSGSALRWEGNRRSGFASAERHRICHISTYRQNGLRKRDEHPTNTRVRCIELYYFYFILSEAIH